MNVATNRTVLTAHVVLNYVLDTNGRTTFTGHEHLMQRTLARNGCNRIASHLFQSGLVPKVVLTDVVFHFVLNLFLNILR